MSPTNMIRAASRLMNNAASRSAGDSVLLTSRQSKQQARTMAAKAVTLENINPNIVRLEYAVRGPLVIRATEIEKELEKGAQKPFKQVIKANIGDAHAMGQKPITFIRQVLACVADPQLIDSANFPADVKQRAKDLLAACGGGSMGSYSASHGIEMIRRHAAEYIERRDGHPANWADICLSSGASNAIKNVLQLFCNNLGGKPSGVMIPIPQYPLYSASLAEYGLEQVGYYLDEDHQWGLDPNELERSLKEAQKNCNVRALVVINPGNPTGQVLTRQNIEDVIKFAHKHRLFIFADEVYQDNVYAKGSQFHSFKKVLREMGAPYTDSQELASFMSVSKGYMGECGLRGGWMELVNLDPEVQANLYKAISAMLCPTTLGQAAVDCVARPPMPGEPSYDLWIKEKTAVLESLNMRAKMIVDTFNSMEGFTCNVVQGAMYAFPRIDLPPRAIEAARAAGQAPDVFYAFKLLEETVKKGENLMSLFGIMCKKFGLDMSADSIDSIHRVRRFAAASDAAGGGKAAPGTPLPLATTSIPAIIVKFTRRIHKDELLSAARARRPGITSADLDIDGPSVELFFSDHLTPSNKLLLKSARKLRKDNKLKHVWVRDCKILARKTDTSKVILITKNFDFKKIK